MAPDSTADEARWAEAQSLVDRVPTESAEQRLRRWRLFRVLFVATALLLGAVMAIVLFVLLRGMPSRPTEVPTWQAVIGFVISGAGLVLEAFGIVMLWRTNRRLRAWRSPLAVLTRAQRRELLAQVRGPEPVEPGRTPLSRLLAEQLVNLRNVMVANLGLGILWVGQWIAFPTPWRAAAAIGYGLLLGVSWPFVQRDARRARRFLDENPHAAG